jgi:hypothetical protein
MVWQFVSNGQPYAVDFRLHSMAPTMLLVDLGKTGVFAWVENPPEFVLRSAEGRSQSLGLDQSSGSMIVACWVRAAWQLVHGSES